MAMDKLLALFQKLQYATVLGKINWQRTPEPGVFVVSFADYSVSIGEEEYFDEEQHDIDKTVKLSILDQMGEIVEVAYPGTLVTLGMHNAYAEMYKLYGSARRKAMGVDRALDTILAALPVEVPSSTESDDEVPF